MHRFVTSVRALLTRLSIALVGFAIVDRARRGMQRRARRTRSASQVLPSLYDVHPAASTAPRRPVGIRSVPIDRIVGTLRRPSQNTADFLPLPHLRGQNWRSRWQRITRANNRLEVLPPIELVQVGGEYWVADGHNRVAAARIADAAEIDADVTQLLIPNLLPSDGGSFDASSMVGGEQLRQAATGRLSRTVEQRTTADETPRSELLRGDETDPEPTVAPDDSTP